MLVKHYPPLPRRNKKSTYRILTKSPSLEEILADVCRCFRQDAEMIKSPSRCSKYTVPRRIYCYVAHVLTNESCDNVADFINRNHTTYLDRVTQCFGWFEINEANWMEDWNVYLSKSQVWGEYYLLKKQALIDGHSQYNKKIREEARYWRRQIKQAKAQKIKWKKEFTLAAKDKNATGVTVAKANIEKYSERLTNSKYFLSSINSNNGKQKTTCKEKSL